MQGQTVSKENLGKDQRALEQEPEAKEWRGKGKTIQEERNTRLLKLSSVSLKIQWLRLILKFYCIMKELQILGKPQIILKLGIPFIFGNFSTKMV